MRTASGICPVGNHPFEYEIRPGTRPVYCSPQHQSKAAYERRKQTWHDLDERQCGRCKTTKPLAEFPGPHTYCRPCHADYTRDRRKINGARDPRYARLFTLRRYGLTPDTFAALLAAQDGKCAICRASEPGGQGWHVDHDHTCCNTRKRSCGKCLRGILCSRCNIGIGNFKDDPVIIQSALDYITAYRARIS